jgi:hypothetical protein
MARRTNLASWAAAIAIAVAIAAPGAAQGGSPAAGPAASPATAPGSDADPPLPPNEGAFLSAVQEATAAYNLASTEVAREGARLQRRGAICNALRALRGAVKDWTGTVVRFAPAGDGTDMLLITIGDHVALGTWDNEAEDELAGRTLIKKSSPLFEALSATQPGDAIIFSGSFVYDPTDCARELSLTLEGSMTDPEFLFRFDSLSKAHKP